MGVFDPNYKRLWLLLVLFIYLSVMYTAEAVILFAENPTEIQITGESPTGFDIDEQNESGIQVESEQQGADLFSLIAFITFAQPEALPVWMLVFLTPITTITFIVFLYLVIDITYDIIKALPFT